MRLCAHVRLYRGFCNYQIRNGGYITYLMPDDMQFTYVFKHKA